SAKRAKEIGDRALHCSIEIVPGDLSDHRRDAFPAVFPCGRWWKQRRRVDIEFGFDQGLPDYILGIKGGKAASQILEFTHVSRPGIASQALHRGRLNRLDRKALR